MYLLSDLFITKQFDTYIHHTIGLILYSFVYMNNLSEESENILMKPFIAVEISSIFYNINYLYPNNFSLMNKLLFFTTFFYYRIYNYYYCVLMNDYINHTIENTGQISKYFYYSAIYNLYALNLYWFSKMIKIILRKLK